ncbi:MAG: hypothetical protein HOD37_15595 [Bacteroidetes bacterium]|jgi:hypothetical protein|nr:hypothetical protein [Bacteroidota bacterium]
MNKEVKNTEKLYHQLMSQEEIAFPLPRKRMKASTDRGVYIIFDPHCTVVHVGRTPRAKNGIRQRLYDHLGGRSSFTQNYLNNDGKKLRGEYTYKYLIVKNPRSRALLEAYTIGHLSPKHLGLGGNDETK